MGRAQEETRRLPRRAVGRRTWRGAGAALAAASLLLLAAAARPPALARAAVAPTCAGAFTAAAAAVDITPQPPQGHSLSEINLGGYGLGGSGGVQGGKGRPATWVRDPIFARAFAVGCSTDPSLGVAVEEIDNQGMSVAYRVGSYGLEDIRGAAALVTGIPRSHIAVASNHSHAGPDLIGAWGFVPDWYLLQVRDGAVTALVQAAAARQPVRLSIGSADGTALVHTQYNDPAVGANDAVDGALRLLQAHRLSDDAVIASVVEFAAHSTVMGGGNQGISPDWMGPTATALEASGYGTVVMLEGTNGKTQPTRPSDSTIPIEIRQHKEMTSPSDPQDSDGYSEHAYASAIVAALGGAASSAVTVRGHGLDGSTLYITDPATNPFLLALLTGGTVAGAQVERSNTPPWAVGNSLGTLVASLRIGDVVIDSAPGESYPNIQNTIVQATGTLQEHLYMGLSDDQLGYLISPASEEPTAAQQAALSGNDNLLFNSSTTVGDHVLCALLQSLGNVGATVDATKVPADCALLGTGIAEDSVPLVTPGPSVPDLRAPAEGLLLICLGIVAAALAVRRFRPGAEPIAR